jgi:acetyl-CoA carboxylase biotin carboxyl carrier protein
MTDPADHRPRPRPDPIPPPREPDPPRPRSEDSLLGLIDRLSAVLERSDLVELEIEAGGTALLLRKPFALMATTAVLPAPTAAGEARPGQARSGSAAIAEAPAEEAPSTRMSVKAPLTGLFYSSPAPGSAPYVRVGGEVAVGQVIGLIEAMKLFNEIKSDVAGRVVGMPAENGALVKAKQPLIEVEPL